MNGLDAGRKFMVAAVLLSLALWQRWPTFGFSLWNVDEAIHAAAARTILDGGVLYRDAVDQRTPLTYYAVAAIFGVAGENNLPAVRVVVALLIAATGFLLYLAGRRLQSGAGGMAGALLYVALAGCVLSPGDAYAAHTEWFVAFFSAAAAWCFLAGLPAPSSRRLFLAGFLYGCAFLSKQPALLDLAAPAAALAYLAWQQAKPLRRWLPTLFMLVAGWVTVVVVVVAYFAAKGALHDGIFYTWTYNLTYYGPEITTADRLGSLAVTFQLIGRSQMWLLAAWAGGALAVLYRLAQRNPAPAEVAANPGLVLLATWSLAGLAQAAAGGRGFDHYSIPFLAPFCLGAGVVLARVFSATRLATTPAWLRLAGLAVLVAVPWAAGAGAIAARGRTLPGDASLRVSAFIRAHSAPADRVFVWGYYPDIYLFADRRPASRYLYASFLTGLIPWTNTAPERETTYAIVPGAMDQLLHDLAARPPLFVVDCSAGPNRAWQKYPLEKFPRLLAYLNANYRVVEGGQFVPQGFRLYQRRAPGESAEVQSGPAPLPESVTATLKIGAISQSFAPIWASAPLAQRTVLAGHLEYFAHAPSSIRYRIPPGIGVLHGGFGLRPGAYAPENKTPTDGAEFIIRWRPSGGAERILLRRLLRPREDPADRPVQSFAVELAPGAGGELELAISPGPADNNASDWTFWTDLVLENSP